MRAYRAMCIRNRGKGVRIDQVRVRRIRQEFRDTLQI